MRCTGCIANSQLRVRPNSKASGEARPLAEVAATAEGWSKESASFRPKRGRTLSLVAISDTFGWARSQVAVGRAAGFGSIIKWIIASSSGSAGILT